MLQNRERIVLAASEAFRERGFDGVSVSEVMQRAGMTHGGFYGHFASKDALAAEVVTQALGLTVARWQKTLGEGGEGGLQRIVDAYLSTRHRDNPGSGCVVAALAGDVPRQAEPVRDAFAKEFETLVDTLVASMPGKGEAVRRELAIALLTQLVGTIMLARALGGGALSDEVLAAVSASLRRQGG
ncbi:MAG: Transcriptional regulator, TetR family [Herminiimonas sp.]|nr:Transcriptional regulator, TetR family [Herminiimonas sp.]